MGLVGSPLRLALFFCLAAAEIVLDGCENFKNILDPGTGGLGKRGS